MDAKKEKLAVGAAATIAGVAVAYALWKLTRTPLETHSSKLLKEYDYIVVGSGSAGAVVATRLSEDPNVSVLVLEAGGVDDLDFPCRFPLGSYLLQETQRDWNFFTETQEHSHKLMKDEKSRWPRGKVLGGSSILNYMAYVRGNPGDYDKWAELGCDGWSYRDVLPFFKKSENVQVPELKESRFHGTDGPLFVSKSSAPHAVTETFFQACEELGIKYNPDYNSDKQLGCSKFQHTTNKGMRWSTASAFLRPALKKRKNLHLITHAHVTRVIFNSQKQAVGVAYKIVRNGKIEPEVIVPVRREAIISGGAVCSPQILLLSGIGPRAALEKLGIPVVFDNPNVGENLRDHTTVPMWAQLRTPTHHSGKAGNFINLLRYLFFKSGPLASTYLEGTAFYKTGFRPDLGDLPDMQLHFSPFNAASSDPKSSNHVKPEYVRDEESITGEWFGGIGFFPALLHPKSIGYIRLRSNNPLDPPIIQPNYYSHSDDMKVMVDGVKKCKEILETKAFKPTAGKILTGKIGPIISQQYPEYSDKWWEEFIRYISVTIYHPVGTCAMGPSDSKTAVLNPQLQVLGVSRLRVIDASIMPVHVSGNTNAPSIMIGEKGADLVKASWKQH